MVARSSDPTRALPSLVDFLIRTGAHTSYLALLGGSDAQYLDHRGNVQAGIDALPKPLPPDPP